jgi:hypothetical protein
MVVTKPLKHSPKGGYISKEKILIGGKNTVVYTGLRGGKYYIKLDEKVYLKGGTVQFKENTQTRIIEPRTKNELINFAATHKNNTQIFSNEEWVLLKDDSDKPFYWLRGTDRNSATRNIPQTITNIMAQKNADSKTHIYKTHGFRDTTIDNKNKMDSIRTGDLYQLVNTIPKFKRNTITFTSDTEDRFENDFPELIKRMKMKLSRFSIRLYMENAIKFIKNLGENIEHITKIYLDLINKEDKEDKKDSVQILVFSKDKQIDTITIDTSIDVPVPDSEHIIKCFTINGSDMKTLNFRNMSTENRHISEIIAVEFIVKGKVTKIPIKAFLKAARNKKDLDKLSELLGKSIKLYCKQTIPNPIQSVNDFLTQQATILSLYKEKPYIIIEMKDIDKHVDKQLYDEAFMKTYGTTITVNGKREKPPGKDLAIHRNANRDENYGKRKWATYIRNTVEQLNTHMIDVMDGKYGNISDNTRTAIVLFQSEIEQLKNLDKHLCDLKIIFNRMYNNESENVKSDEKLLIQSFQVMKTLMSELIDQNPKLIDETDEVFIFIQSHTFVNRKVIDAKERAANEKAAKKAYIKNLMQPVVFSNTNIGAKVKLAQKKAVPGKWISGGNNINFDMLLENTVLVKALKDYDEQKYLSRYLSTIDLYLKTKVGQYSSNFKGLKEGSMHALQWLNTINWSDNTRLAENGSDLFSFYERLQEFRNYTPPVNNIGVNKNNPLANREILGRQLSKASKNGITTPSSTRVSGMKKDLIKAHLINGLNLGQRGDLTVELKNYLDKSLPSKSQLNNNPKLLRNLKSNFSNIQQGCVDIQKKYQLKKKLTNWGFNNGLQLNKGSPSTIGGLSSNKKKVRKHQGIYQSGPKVGQLKSGFRYTGEKTTTGLRVIRKK